MNKARKEEIARIVLQLGVLRDELELVMGEEQEALDNIPEGIQTSERGERMEENVDAIEEAANHIVEGIDILEDMLDENM